MGSWVLFELTYFFADVSLPNKVTSSMQEGNKFALIRHIN